MGQNGGKREGAGRKKTLYSEQVAILRDKITDADFDLAIDTLRFAMRNVADNLKAALSASIFIAEQKIGRAPQIIDVNTTVDNVQSIDVSALTPDDLAQLRSMLSRLAQPQPIEDHATVAR